MKIIKGFEKQLAKLNSVTEIHDPEIPKSSLKTLFSSWEILAICPQVSTGSLFNVHVHLFLKMAKDLKIPLGRFSESALEMRNKDRRKARLRFARKNSIENNTADIYHYLLRTSDPLVNMF